MMKRLSFLLMLIVLLGGQCSQVMALSDAQKKVLGVGVQYFNTSSASACSTAPTSGPAGTQNNNVFFVGDALMNGMKSAGLANKVVAAGGQVSQIEATDDINVDDSISKVQSDDDPSKVDRQNLAKAGTVVIELGTFPNSSASVDKGSFGPKIDTMIKVIKALDPDVANIYWMNTYANNDHDAYSGINQAINDEASVDGYKVIDWHSEALNNNSKYAPFDSSSHVQPTQYSNLADFVVKAISSSLVVSGSSTSLTFPNSLDPATTADAINSWIAKTNPDSALKDLGATIVASAKAANVSPFLVVAIANQESSLANPKDYNVIHGSNSFGRTALDSQPHFEGSKQWYYWPSVKASVDYTDPVNQTGSNSDEVAFLAAEYSSYISSGDLSGLIKKYDPNVSEYTVYIPAAAKAIAAMAAAAGGSSSSTTTTTAPGSTSDGSDVTCCATSSTPGNGDPTAGLTGNSPQEQAFNFFVNNAGFTPAQAAGVVGNLQQESGVSPTSSDGAGNGGIAGFTSYDLSMAAMTAWVTQKGEDPMSLKGQLDFLLWYVTISHPAIAADMKKTTSPSEAALVWENELEGCLGSRGTGDPNAPGSCLQNKRISNAEGFYQQFGGNTSGGGSTITTSPGCVDPTMSPDCQSVTGNEAILCEAKKYDPVSYVWGGGHGGGKAYHQNCPTIGTDSACGLDCSGLVGIAVYDAFGVNLSQTTYAQASDSTHWAHVSASQLQPGDLIQPDTGHVEIVDHVSGGRIYTFGAHTDNLPQPNQVGSDSYPQSSNNVFLRWKGHNS